MKITSLVTLSVLAALEGTPPQPIYVQLDTGSSDLIVETPTSNLYSAAPPNPCTIFGPYSANDSSTYQYIDGDFLVAFGGGDGASGDWASDTLSIGGATLTGAQFGIQYQTTVQEGILGVSYPVLEGRHGNFGLPEYDNLPSLLVKQGYIASRAFSLWTNDDTAASGTLLFGGIDTAKFTGKLVTIDLVPSGFGGQSVVVDFTINMLSVTGSGVGGTPVTLSGGSIPVLLDSGTTITLLPPAITQAIWNYVGATATADNANVADLPCPAPDSTVTIDLEFEGITIKVPIKQLAFDLGDGTCLFLIFKNDGGAILGDPTLAAMYVVYDIDNDQVSIPPTVFNAAGENILQIMAGPGGVPDSVGPSTSSSSSSTSKTSSTTSKTSTSSSTSKTSTSSTSKTSTSSTTSKTSTSTSKTSTSSTKSSSTSKTSTTTKSSTSSHPPTTSPPASTAKPTKCNQDNCLRVMSNTVAGSSFCAFINAGIPVATPTVVAANCMTLTSRVSSACACYFTGTGVPTSTTLATSTTTKPATPPVCNQNNCFRAVQNLPNEAAFCASVNAGLPVVTPTKIVTSCSALPSKVSSACACLAT